MSHQTLNDGDTGLVFRTKLNDNFNEMIKTHHTKVIVALATPSVLAVTSTPVTQLFADTILYEENMLYTIATGIYENIDAGLYKYDFFVLANWQNGLELLFSAWVDGVQLGTNVPVTGTGKNLPVTIPYYFPLTANQEVEIKLHLASGTTNVDLINASIGLSLEITPEP